MLNWVSTGVMESSIDPGVRITFRRFSQRLRSALELQLAEYRCEVRDKMLEYADPCSDNFAVIDEGLRDNDGNLVLDEHGKAVHAGDSGFIRAQKRTRQTAFNEWLQSHIERYLKPATLRTYVTQVEGLLIDGEQVVTVEQLLDGPAEFADEAYSYIVSRGALQQADIKNSQSPSTLPAVEGGDPIPTTADSAATAA